MHVSIYAMGGIAERKNACVEHAYMVECVKAEKQAGMGKKRCSAG